MMQTLIDLPDLESEKAVAFIAGALSTGSINFREAVYHLVREVPPAKVVGYGEVARLLGSPRAARQVGFALGALKPELTDPDYADHVPWWRVIRSDGSIAHKGDPYRSPRQIAFLRAEGVEVLRGVVQMKRFGWLSSSPMALDTEKSKA